MTTRLMQGGGIDRGDHPRSFVLSSTKLVDGVDANQLDEQGRETKIETADFSSWNSLLNCRVGRQRSSP